MNTLRLGLAGLLFGLLALALQAADRYVVEPGTIDPSASAPPYNAWTNAATNIQWAVDAAAASETVWVSNGTYTIASPIVITEGIVLCSTNGPEATLIDGNFTDGDLTTNRCLVLSNAAALVHGLTISNGGIYCSGDVNTDYGAGVLMYAGILSNCHVLNHRLVKTVYGWNKGGFGAGIYALAGTVTACRVANNLVTNVPSNGDGTGAGIYAGSTFISDCVISNNRVLGGGTSSGAGGLRLSGRSAKSCRIVDNTCEKGYGGGAIVQVSGVLDDCLVSGNFALIGGGVNMILGTITNCVISNNTAASWVSGIRFTPQYIYSSVKVYNTTITEHYPASIPAVYMTGAMGSTNFMIGCLITNNDGAGVYVAGTNDVVSHCDIRGNGDGLRLGNGTVRNCLIAGNTNRGIQVDSACQSGTVSACTIAGNPGALPGSGIRFEATAPVALRVSSCIIYANGASGTDDVYDATTANAGALQYSCVGDNPGFTGDGIVVGDPKFMNAATGNYRLASGTPCLNAGLEEAWMASASDLDGNPRIQNGAVDMGAYERLIAGGTVMRFY